MIVFTTAGTAVKATPKPSQIFQAARRVSTFGERGRRPVAANDQLRAVA